MFIVLMASACSNKNSNIQENTSHSMAQNENLNDDKAVKDNISPEIPDPLPPAKGGITVAPLPPAKKEDRYGVIYDTEKYEEEKALSQVIKYHNNDKSSKVISFPNTIKVGETISKEVTKDDDLGNIKKIDAMATVEKKDESYVVTLTMDYNMTLNGEEVINFWKYEVSKDDIKLIDKNDDIILDKEIE